jgi:hypothetical protein
VIHNAAINHRGPAIDRGFLRGNSERVMKAKSNAFRRQLTATWKRVKRAEQRAKAEAMKADPIYALIEAHRAALAVHLAAVRAQSDLEERLVDERMAAAGSSAKGSDAWYEAIQAANRDPLYTAAEALSDTTSDAEIAAA